MKTAELTRQLVSIGKELLDTDLGDQHKRLEQVQAQIDAFISDKQLPPLAASKKLTRLGEKVMLGCQDKGMSFTQAQSYTAHLGLPKMRTIDGAQRRLSHLEELFQNKVHAPTSHCHP